MRRSNVLRFPSEPSGGSAIKLFALVFYAGLAFLLTLQPLSDHGLGLLIVFGLLYNFFVRGRAHQSHYFRKNAWLLLILLILLLLVYRWVVIMVLLVCGIYWLLVGRSHREAPYFLRFHILTALILNFFLLMPLLIFNSLVVLAGSLFDLAGLEALVAPYFGLYGLWMPVAARLLFWLPALYLSVMALMGRTPDLGLITRNVRPWA